MSIIEKLGIPKVDYWTETINYTTYHSVEDIKQVKELEQQRNETLEALIDLMKGVQGLPPLTAIRGTLEKEWQYGLNVIEKACYPLKWEEIKQIVDKEK